MLYEQQGTQLVERHGHWDSAGWDPDGTGEHSVAAKVYEMAAAVVTPWSQTRQHKTEFGSMTRPSGLPKAVI